MPNILINMCEKFHCVRLRNDRARTQRTRTRTTFVATGDPFPGPKELKLQRTFKDYNTITAFNGRMNGIKA